MHVATAIDECGFLADLVWESSAALEKGHLVEGVLRIEGIFATPRSDAARIGRRWRNAPRDAQEKPPSRLRKNSMLPLILGGAADKQTLLKTMQVVESGAFTK